MSWAFLVLGLVLFVGLVVVHEWGHFLAARRNDVDVDEFGIGFPPQARVIARKNGTEYSLNWLPLGGFVRLKGEHDADTAKGSFGAASLKAKVKIMTAGVGMNLLTAFIIFTFLALIGMPVLLENQYTVPSDTKISRQDVMVGSVEANSPASAAGLRVRDTILSIGPVGQTPTPVTSQEELSALTKQFAGQTVVLTIKSDGQTTTKTATLLSQKTVDESQGSDNPKGYLGISRGEYTLQRSTWSAPIVAGGFMAQLTAVTFKGLGTAISGLSHGNVSQASSQVAGPIGVFLLIKNGSFLGLQFILVIIGVISLTLAIMNILPIPALDGGRLFLILFYRAIRRPLSAEREELINGIGFVFLMILFVLITIVDIKRH